MTTLSSLARAAILPLGLTGGCWLIASVTDTDPMLAVELAVLTLIAAWVALLAAGMRRARADRTRLAAVSRPIDLRGTKIRLLHGFPPAAFVSGLWRPDVYLSRSLIDSLDDAELRAVLLHEQHHRQTLAPLRGLALESWRPILSWLPLARRALAVRLAALEIEADAAAIAGGVSPATLASALLKCDAVVPATLSAFTSASEIRIDALIAWDRHRRVSRRLSVPVEWVAPVGAALTLWACHVIGP